MIIGIGQDMVNIERIARLYERFGKVFLQRVFTEAEQKKALESHFPANFLAKRFAAKEATAKALGIGFSQGIRLRDIEVITHPSGRPLLQLHGKALNYLTDLLPEATIPRLDISLTDAPPWAVAMVVISVSSIVAVPR
ncbi:MAG: holo-ACP synthase [Alphaproteobacteria bacterium]